jgi:hypothetical protein
MHRQHRYTGSDLIIRGPAAPPFGPGFPASLLANADVLECWVSDVSESEDWTEWRLWQANAVIAQQVVPGY